MPKHNYMTEMRFKQISNEIGRRYKERRYREKYGVSPYASEFDMYRFSLWNRINLLKCQIDEGQQELQRLEEKVKEPYYG